MFSMKKNFDIENVVNFCLEKHFLHFKNAGYFSSGNWGTQANQYPPVRHPLDAHYYSAVDEPQLS
jgi:hypothetical protein